MIIDNQRGWRRLNSYSHTPQEFHSIVRDVNINSRLALKKVLSAESETVMRHQLLFLTNLVSFMIVSFLSEQAKQNCPYVLLI